MKTPVQIESPVMGGIRALAQQWQAGVLSFYRSDKSGLSQNDGVSSLSVILLNDDYYRFLLEGRTVIDGISILDAEHIIPLKMKAWLDLNNSLLQKTIAGGPY